MSILTEVKNRFDKNKFEHLSLGEYLDLVKSDKSIYANPAERMLAAIGPPTLVETRKDSKQSRIFSNRVIKVYPTFHDFYGMETTIEKIVAYFTHAAQGLEEKKQVLYLLGPVGSAKSSLAERLKQLIEQQPIYVLKANDQLSPVFESPLGLFAKADSEALGVPERYLNARLSPWALKRLKEFDGDISKFSVVKLYPNQANQIAISKTEPGDENNQDISALVGKIDIRKLAKFSQNDPDAYSYSGGLCLSNQGLLEFVEMFKAPIKVLHPLLTATQEGNYNGTEAISSIPFEGIILAHSNESEWTTFRNNKNNEAFIDRIYIVKVPYVLRTSEETKIYKKLLDNSALSKAPCAPHTLELLSTLCVLSRLKEPKTGNILSKAKAYNGENTKDFDVKSKSCGEYQEDAGVDEGMSGLSTRQAYKILADVFNYDGEEISANPVHLFYIIKQRIKQEQLPQETEQKILSYVETHLEAPYKTLLDKELQSAYLDSHDEFGQNMFDHYVDYADAWMQEQDYLDSNTGERWDRDALNKELEKIEKPAEIANPKDFRGEVVHYVLRQRANNGGKVNWKHYEKLKTVIEKSMFSKAEDLIPVISFGTKGSKQDAEKHNDFVDRMKERGYTEKQIRVLVEWFQRVRHKL